MASPARLPRSHLPNLLAADTALYPSSSRLSLTQLESWVDAAPSFSLLFPSGGVIIALPMLAPHWHSLVAGDLNEWDINTTMLLPKVESQCAGHFPAEVGIHCWHIERNGEPSKFGRRVMMELKQRAEGLGIGIIGWSALTVTEDGAGLFRSFGWRERVVDQDRGGGRFMWSEGEDWRPPVVNSS